MSGSIWADSTADRAPVWCDVTSTLRLGGDVALPAGALSLSWLVVHVLRFTPSPSIKRLNGRDRFVFRVIDASLLLGLPLFVMAVHPIWQPRRYVISSGIGCRPSMALTLPAIFCGPCQSLRAWPDRAGLVFGPMLATCACACAIYIAWRLVTGWPELEEIAAPAAKLYDADTFNRLGLLAAVLGPITFACSLLTAKAHFDAAGPYRAEAVATIRRDVSEPLVDTTTTRAGPSEILPVLVGLSTVVILCVGGGPLQAIGRCFGRRRQLWGPSREVDEGFVVDDIDSASVVVDEIDRRTWRSSRRSPAVPSIELSRPPMARVKTGR